MSSEEIHKKRSQIIDLVEFATHTQGIHSAGGVA